MNMKIFCLRTIPRVQEFWKPHRKRQVCSLPYKQEGRHTHANLTSHQYLGRCLHLQFRHWRSFPPCHAVRKDRSLFFEGHKGNCMLTSLSHAFGDSPPLLEVTLPIHTSLEDSVKKLDWASESLDASKDFSFFCILCYILVSHLLSRFQVLLLPSPLLFPPHSINLGFWRKKNLERILVGCGRK